MVPQWLGGNSHQVVVFSMWKGRLGWDVAWVWRSTPSIALPRPIFAMTGVWRPAFAIDDHKPAAPRASRRLWRLRREERGIRCGNGRRRTGRRPSRDGRTGIAPTRGIADSRPCKVRTAPCLDGQPARAADCAPATHRCRRLARSSPVTYRQTPSVRWTGKRRRG